MRARGGVGAALLAATALLASASAAAAQQPQRWAVVVGINDYANFEGVEGGDLRGAVNDARSMADVLMARWGFPAGNVRLLLDAEATRAGIEEALTGWLASRVKPGDQALFFYAGHGSQTIDMEGDEEDGLDETLAPQDVLATSSDNDITDDQLRGWLERIPTDQIVVVFDACHSGTATRALSTRMRPRSLPREAPRAVGTRGGGTSPEPGLLRGSVALEIAAAAPDQVAMDALFAPRGGTTPYAGGAFTTHLVRQLWRAEAGTAYQDVFRAAFEGMKAERFAQDPQISGSAAQPLFAVGPGEVTPLKTGEVAAGQAAGKLVLRAGPAQGVTVGSLYALGDELVRVEEVSEAGAVAASVAPGAPGASRAVARLSAYVPAAPPLRLAVGDVERVVADRLRAGLAPEQYEVVDDDQADLFLRRAEGGARVLTAEGSARATVAGEGGALADALAAALRQEWAAQRIAALENPAPAFSVDVSFVQGVQEFLQRDPIALRVRSERSGHLTLLDLGTDGTVTVLYPNRFVPEGRIEAGVPLEIPTAAMPFRLRASGPEGWGMVRAVVTPGPLALPATDEPLLSQKDGVVLADVAVRALHRALSDLWTGSAPLGDALPVEGWSTGIVNYRIVR
ncbi:MAG TPA: caspase family protein [Longimicrobiales bacterium]|nr:caspase family protein [Longimicrobiales bacterium]